MGISIELQIDNALLSNYMLHGNRKLLLLLVQKRVTISRNQGIISTLSHSLIVSISMFSLGRDTSCLSGICLLVEILIHGHHEPRTSNILVDG